MSKSQDRVIARDRVIDSIVEYFAQIARILRAALREIFDESAYERFLRRTNSVRSIESYREFSRERDPGLSRKPRCC